MLDTLLILEDDALPDPRPGLNWNGVWDMDAHEIATHHATAESCLYVGQDSSCTLEGSRLICVLI